MTATSGKNIDVLVETVQFGQAYEGVTGEAVLSGNDFVRLVTAIDGNKTELHMTAEEADNLARVLSETSARLRRVVRRPNDYPAYRFIRTAFRIGGHS